MVLWMRHRGHSWQRCGEMAGAMFLLAFALLVLFWLGVVSAQVVLPLEMALMIPVMGGVRPCGMTDTRAARCLTVPTQGTLSARQVERSGQRRAMRFAYFYFMSDERDRVRAVVGEHIAYWRERRLRQFLGGPFGDRSGGLITFEIGSSAEADQLVSGDPFARAGLLERWWLKEWIAD
jgi:uncharacterized protein YciI